MFIVNFCAQISSLHANSFLIIHLTMKHKIFKILLLPTSLFWVFCYAQISPLMFFSSESWTEGWRNCNHILCFHNFHSFFFNLEEMKLFSRSVQSYSFLELFHFSITLKTASFIFTFYNLRLRFTLMNWNSLILNRDAHRKAYSS